VTSVALAELSDLRGRLSNHLASVNPARVVSGLSPASWVLAMEGTSEDVIINTGFACSALVAIVYLTREPARSSAMYSTAASTGYIPRTCTTWATGSHFNQKTVVWIPARQVSLRLGQFCRSYYFPVPSSIPRAWFIRSILSPSLHI